MSQGAENAWQYTNLDLEVWVNADGGTIRVEGNGQLVHYGRRPENLTLELGDSTLFTLQGMEAKTAGGQPLETVIAPEATLAHITVVPSSSGGEEIRVHFTVHASTDSLTRGEVILVPWFLGWYPVPSTKPEELPNFRIAGQTTFHLPPTWLAITNGEQQEIVRTDSTTTMTWQIDLPTERSFCGGPYRQHEFMFSDRSMNVFLLNSIPDDGEPQARALVRSLTDLEAHFGPHPYPTPSLVEFPEYQEWWHASASHGFVLAETGAFLYAGANLPLFAHEVAHAWWGNLVRAGGSGAAFCTESLAQYGAVLAVEALRDERDATEFLRWSSPGYTAYDCARGYFALVLQELDRPLSELGTSLLDFQLAYSKGPSVLRMLRRRIGDELFFKVLRGLIEDHRDEVLTLDVLRSRFVAAAPAAADLEMFFAQWLDREGGPVLEMQWEETDDGSGLSITIEQVHVGEPFSMWLDLGVLSGGGVSVHRVNITETRTETMLPVQGPIEMVVLDPKHYLLIWDPEYGVRAVRDGREKR